MNTEIEEVVGHYGRWQRIGVIVSPSWRDIDLIAERIHHLSGGTVVFCADFPRRNKVKNIVLARKRNENDMKYEAFEGNPFDVIRKVDGWLYFWDMDANTFEQELAGLMEVLKEVRAVPGQYITVDGQAKSIMALESTAHWETSEDG